MKPASRGLGFRVWGLGIKVWSPGFRVWGPGFGVEGPWFRVCTAIMFFTIVETFSLFAQSLSVFNVDASSFPNMKAQFYAFDAAGNRITVNSTVDATVLEDSNARTVTRVTCPPVTPPLPISSVLTIDISGSMDGSGIGIAKAAANAWINALQLGPSECAITTFSDNAYLNQDFTTDRTALLNVVNSLSAKASTDYDRALLNPPAGSLQVTKHGLPIQKIIVFLSDGLPNNPPDQDAIIAEARKQKVVIYGVIIGDSAPQIVKDICGQTGGLCFEHITTEQQAADIYRQILQAAQGGSACDLDWTSDGCGQPPKLIVSLPAYSVSDTLSYSAPMSSLPQLAYAPARSLHFGQVLPPAKPTMTITLSAQGKLARVDSVKRSDNRFRVSDYGGSAPPFSLGVGQSRTFTVEFAPSDSSYAFCLFTVMGDACARNTFYADAGWRGVITQDLKLKVMHPNGGERFVAGNDEVLTWEGVMPEENVKLEYRTSPAANWTLITDTATGLRYEWRVPKTPSNTCLLQATTQARQAYVGDMALIPAGTFRMGNITNNSSGSADEKPVHEVTITHSFLMSRTEVTQAKWKAVMGPTNNPSSFKGDSLPVESVTWYDAVSYCNLLSQQEGLETCYIGNLTGTNIVCDFTANGYRLPTEAEWEYACRDGTDTTDLYSGNITNSLCSPIDPAMDRVGWYCGNTTVVTKSVRQKIPNKFGLFDMHGNVWEWCWDWYSSTYYKSNAVSDPCGPAAGTSRILRGGGWNNDAYSCRSASRLNEIPVDRGVFFSYGLRVVRIY
jgi:formylglycine-generating enzyme